MCRVRVALVYARARKHMRTISFFQSVTRGEGVRACVRAVVNFISIALVGHQGGQNNA